jgi:hypothetical protein
MLQTKMLDMRLPLVRRQFVAWIRDAHSVRLGLWSMLAMYRRPWFRSTDYLGFVVICGW